MFTTLLGKIFLPVVQAPRDWGCGRGSFPNPAPPLKEAFLPHTCSAPAALFLWWLSPFRSASSLLEKHFVIPYGENKSEGFWSTILCLWCHPCFASSPLGDVHLSWRGSRGSFPRGGQRAHGRLCCHIHKQDVYTHLYARQTFKCSKQPSMRGTGVTSSSRAEGLPWTNAAGLRLTIHS